MKKYFTVVLFLIIISAYLTFVSFRDKDNAAVNSADNSSLIQNYKQMNANTIWTWYGNNGSFNHDPFNPQLPGFEWPHGSGIFARFSTGLWIGAKVANDTLVAVSYYSFEYTSGYTDNNGVPQGQNDPLYRVYKIVFGLNDQDRAEWPNSLLGNSNQGAPVFYDNSSNSWKPLDFGLQTMFCSYTDSYPGAHTSSIGSTAPLKADIKQLNFALNVGNAQDNIIYQQYKIINRSTSTWTNAYFTIWTDDDLGFSLDDKVGCDSARGLGYTYNNTNNDPNYGPAPPAVGLLMLKGALRFTGNNSDTAYICRTRTRVGVPRYVDLGMTVFNFSVNDNSPDGNPVGYAQAYRLMKGLRRDGAVRINPVGPFPTTYAFTGDPVTNTGWVQSLQNDQRFMMSTGPVNVSPGDTQVIVIAQIIARGTSNLNSITFLRQYSSTAQQYSYGCYSNPAIGIENNNELANDFRLYQNYPNPFNPATKIKFDVPSNLTLSDAKGLIVVLTIYDVLGREAAVLVNDKLSPGTYEAEWDATNYPSGVYLYKLTAGDYTETRRMVLIK